MSAPGHPNDDHAPIAVDDVVGIEIRIAKLRGSRKHKTPRLVVYISRVGCAPNTSVGISNKFSKACASALPIPYVPNTAQTSTVVVSREPAATHASFRRRHRVSVAIGT